jgi:hypothetical protein
MFSEKLKLDSDRWLLRNPECATIVTISRCIHNSKSLNYPTFRGLLLDGMSGPRLELISDKLFELQPAVLDVLHYDFDRGKARSSADRWEREERIILIISVNSNDSDVACRHGGLSSSTLNPIPW